MISIQVLLSCVYDRIHIKLQNIESGYFMKNERLNERQSNVRTAVGLAAIDGGKPSDFTKKLLKGYEKGLISSKELKDEILKKYAKVSQ